MIRIYMLVLLPSIAFTLRGDTIELKTGERIEGVFKQATPVGAVIEVGGQPITIPLEKVRAIYFGESPARATVGPSLTTEAMDALKAIESVTGGGITYREYSQRILDARVKVDRYLSSNENKNAEIGRAIRVAMLEYEFAARAWFVSLDTSQAGPVVQAGELMLNPELGTCPIVQEMINRAKKRDAMSYGVQVVIARGGVTPAVWTCAATQIGIAEGLLPTKQ